MITNFKFIEDVNHIITIQSSIWGGIYFNRYLDPREGNIIQFNFLERKIYLKRNVGLSTKLSKEYMSISVVQLMTLSNSYFAFLEFI